MVKRTGPTNPVLRELIKELKTLAIEKKQKFWKRIATELEKPTRQRRIVNTKQISIKTKENEEIVVPGKVLGNGLINHPVIVYAWAYSRKAKQLIESAKGKALSIKDLIKKGNVRVRILG